MVCPAYFPSCTHTVEEFAEYSFSITFCTLTVVWNRSETSSGVKSCRRGAGRIEDTKTSDLLSQENAQSTK